MPTKPIVDVDMDQHTLTVHRLRPTDLNLYVVKVDDVVKHPDCSAEDVMRALGHYIFSLSHKLEKLNEVPK